MDLHHTPAFDSALQALLAGEIDVAQQRFLTAHNQGERAADALYLLAVCLYLRGRNDDQVLAALDQSARAGKVSQDFFPALGKVIARHGDRGEDLRRFLQLNRRLPWQLVGTLAPDHQDNVEPWHFSRQVVSAFPTKQSEFDDMQKVVEERILPGFRPVRPVFNRSSVVLTMGSCFAQELRNYLAENGMRSDWLFVPPGLNNTFAVRSFVEWCVTGAKSSDAYWYDEAATGGAVKWSPEAEQAHYREVFSRIDGLVLTVGLAEVWHDTVTGGVFWRGVPKSIYDANIHKCRISTVEENVDNLVRIVELVNGARPGLPIIVTLSPVPLRATFEPMSCFAADCISKSTLRVAIDGLMRRKFPNVAYWPSFEIVRWLGGHIPLSMYGEDGNTRHVNRQTVRLILDSFIKHYYVADPSPGVG